MQVRAHKVRKRRKLEPNSQQLEFADPEMSVDNSTIALRAARWKANEDSRIRVAPPQLWEPAGPRTSSIETEPIVQLSSLTIGDARDDAPLAPIVERQPLPPFPRITVPVPKVIEFPRAARTYELAEPVADQLRIFEAVEELPPPPVTHLSEIEIAPEEPVHLAAEGLEVPIQAAPLSVRAYAAAVDAIIILCATGVFVVCAGLFASSLPMNKPLMARGAACDLLLIAIYYLFSLCLGHGSAGMQASGLCVFGFSGTKPSRRILTWRALAIVLSGAALGMGFAWSLIDDDRLCWHDRITHTYLASK